MNHRNNIMKDKTKEKNITRSKKLEKIKIPESSENIFVVPCNPSGYGFLLLEEEKEYLKDIPTHKINKTLRNLNKIIDLALIKKKVEESKDYNASNIFILNILFVLGLFVAFIMYILALFEVENFKDNLIWIPLVILLIIVVLAMFFMIHGLLKKREFININGLITTGLFEAIEKENKILYKQRGYKLELGKQFCWISFVRLF